MQRTVQYSTVASACPSNQDNISYTTSLYKSYWGNSNWAALCLLMKANVGMRQTRYLDMITDHRSIVARPYSPPGLVSHLPSHYYAVTRFYVYQPYFHQLFVDIYIYPEPSQPGAHALGEYVCTVEKVLQP